MEQVLIRLFLLWMLALAITSASFGMHQST